MCLHFDALDVAVVILFKICLVLDVILFLVTELCNFDFHFGILRTADSLILPERAGINDERACGNE